MSEPVGPLMRARLDRHQTAHLAPRARQRARALRKALYASWSVAELHAEAASLAGAQRRAYPSKAYFLAQLVDDVAAQLEARAEQERRSA